MGEIQGIGRITFHDGQVEEFKRLADRIMQIVRTEDTGTLQFEVHLSDDESEAIVLERYQDFAAFVEHAERIGELGPAISATGSVTAACLAEPSEELRTQLAGSPVQLFTPYLLL